jgi:hypothetical protein
MNLHYALREGFINIRKYPGGGWDIYSSLSTVKGFQTPIGHIVVDTSSGRGMIIDDAFVNHYGVEAETVLNLNVPKALQALQT